MSPVLIANLPEGIDLVVAFGNNIVGWGWLKGYLESHFQFPRWDCDLALVLLTVVIKPAASLQEVAALELLYHAGEDNHSEAEVSDVVRKLGVLVIDLCIKAEVLIFFRLVLVTVLLQQYLDRL